MSDFLKKNGTRSVLATIISILIGLVAGAILVLIVGLTSSEIGLKGAWEGISRIIAVAAGLAILLTLGVNIYNKQNICVSFVDGKKVTDKEVVMNDVDNILADLLSDRTGVEEQLNDFFGQ